MFQTPKLYCGGDIGDLTEILQHIRMNIGEAPLITVAMSMGRSVPSFDYYYSICAINCEDSIWPCPRLSLRLLGFHVSV